MDKQVKLTTYASKSTKSINMYPAYLTDRLLSIDYLTTSSISIQDTKETKDKIFLKKVPNRQVYLLEIESDCHFQYYTELEEAVFDLLVYIKNNILPNNKGTLQ